MKRARDRWMVHLFIGVLAIAFTINPKVEAVRATSLIFKTTSTTTTEASEVEAEEGAETEGSPTAEGVATTPASNYTGIPQIDYIHDPNLPRELNGYNLSSYPFYETVPPPEQMDFKCDGLHDGFYASIPHKCQVYHHCLYGTRYDFLCANYTAFDQKTFICQFVSVVDCVNSAKYFSRNDALYIQPNNTENDDMTFFVKPTYFSSGAKYIKKPDIQKVSSSNFENKKRRLPKGDSTQTLLKDDNDIKIEVLTEIASERPKKFIMFKSKIRKSQLIGNEALYKATTSSTVAPPPTTKATTTTPPPPPPPPRQRNGNKRRPSRRRRPQYDYYDDDYYPTAREEDDYYDEDRRRPYGEGRANNRRKRPRPSQRRPSTYDDYEDERFERRPEGRTRYEDDYEDRRSYDRPRKPARRPVDDRDRAEDDDPPPTSYDRNRKNRPNDEKRGGSDYDRRPYDDDRRSYDRPKRPHRDDDRPSRDEEPKEETSFKDERPFRDERPLRERPHRDERPSRDEQRSNNDRRPIKDESSYDDYEEDKKPGPTGPSATGLVKPNGGSIYSKPRVPPKIARPVPNNEKEKYKYVTSPSTKVPSVKPLSDEDYYDDYEVDTPKSPAPKPTTRPRAEQVEKERYKPNIERTRISSDSDNSKRNAGNYYNQRKSEYQESRKPYPDDESYEEVEEPRPKKQQTGRGGTRYTSRKRPVKTDEEYYDDEDIPKRSASERRKETKNNENENVHKEPLDRYNDKPDETERLPIKTEKETSSIKPYFQRNKPTTTTKATTTTTTTEANLSEPEKNEKTETKPHPYVRVVKRPFLPSRGGSPYLPRGLQPLGGKNFNKTTPATSTTTTTTSTTTSTTTENIIQADYSYETDYDTKDDKSSYYSAGSSQESVERPQPVQQNDKRIIPTVASSAEKQNVRQYSYTQKPIPISKPVEEKRRPFIKYEKENSKEYSSSLEDTRPQEKIKINYDQNFKNGGVVQPSRYSNNDYSKSPDRLQTFKPSPQISEPYKPTNRPFTPKIPENISIKQNLADPTENEYDVTLNDALNPTISNLTPVRNFPSPFIVPVERDYTFSRFRNNAYNQEQQVNGYTNYQQQQQQRPVQGKFENSQRFVGHGYVKNDQLADSVASASELVGGPHVVSVRTPQSFYIQHPRYTSGYSADETNSGLRPSHVAYRLMYN